MRASADINRTSHYAASANNANSAASFARMQEKKKETEIVTALEKTSHICVERLEALSKDFDVMADTGQVFGLVEEQWPRMFQILQLFLSQRSTAEDNPSLDEAATGCRLVRVPIEELQEEEVSKSQT